MPRLTVLTLLTDEIMPQLRELTQKVDRLEGRVVGVEEAHAEVKTRLDNMDLNGHTQNLKALALAAPALIATIPTPDEVRLRQKVVEHMPTIEHFLEVAPRVVKWADRQEADELGRSWLAQRLGIQSRAKTIYVTITSLGAIAFAANGVHTLLQYLHVIH